DVAGGAAPRDGPDPLHVAGRPGPLGAADGGVLPAAPPRRAGAAAATGDLRVLAGGDLDVRARAAGGRLGGPGAGGGTADRAPVRVHGGPLRARVPVRAGRLQPGRGDVRGPARPAAPAAV